MLSPKYLEALPQPIIKIYSEFENELLEDIAKRITKADYLTPTAEWRLYKAEQLRLSSREITQRLARLTGRSEKEIRQLYTGALKEALRNDEKIYRAAIKAGCLSEDAEHKLDSYFGSIAFSNALKAGYRNTNGLMRNLCNSAAAQANSRLSDELDKAFLKVASGAYTADEAVYSAVQDLGKSGIKVINYSSGHKDKVDVAVRRAVITGIGQAAGNMQLSLAADMGCDLVEVTAHLGARPSHAVWQGHIYSLSGKDPKYPDFRSSTGYGTGAGLCGWNCRHSFYPYFEGLSKPNGVPFTREENDEVYRNTQKQRAYERAVRQSKRELAALDGARSATDDEALKQKLDRDFRRKAVTLKRREAKLEEHLRNTGLLPDNSRVRVDGFGRSVSQKAVWAERKYQSALHKISESGSNNKILDNNSKPSIIASVGYTFSSDTSQAFRNAFNAQYERAVKIFGDIRTVGRVGVFQPSRTSSEYGEYNDNTFDMNIRFADKPDFLKLISKVAEKFKAEGKWSAGNKYHVIRHEIGHAIVNQHRMYDPDWNDKLKRICDVFSEGKGLDKTAQADLLSVYGFSDYNELIAESIAEYLTQTPRATAEKIVKIILE